MKLTELIAKIHLPLTVGDRIEGLKLRNIRDAENTRLAVEVGEEEAFYMIHAANVLPELVDELNRILDVVGEEDAEIIKGVLARAENVETKQ